MAPPLLRKGQSRSSLPQTSATLLSPSERRPVKSNIAKLKPPRRRLVLAAIALTLTLQLQLPSLTDNESRLRRRLSATKAKAASESWASGLNGPYAPYRGEIEPQHQPGTREERNLQINYKGASLNSEHYLWYENWYGTHENGTKFCNFPMTQGPDMIPEETEFRNTIVVGYPGADKRTVLRQMEAMTAMSGRDAWDFKFLGQTKQPYIKTNYPHHEGIWGWEANPNDQVVLIVRNIRHTIDEYHDILADIDYAKTWSEATDKIPRLFKGSINDEYYVRWRDERTSDEIGWYGWLIDYWMEGGILRDYFDHKLTDKEHWAKLRAPETYTYGELQWDVNICTTDPLPGVDHDGDCDPAAGADCRAKLILSAERLMEVGATGRAENRKIGELLSETPGARDTLVNDTHWDCFYDLLIADNPTGLGPDGSVGTVRTGYHDYRAREGVATRAHVVSRRHLNKMIQQLTRLINKYSAFDDETGFDWPNDPQAQYLVELLTEHRAEITTEYENTAAVQVWGHPPKPNWRVFPKCGMNVTHPSRSVWDYDYPHEFSGYVIEMFPDLTG